MTRDAVRRAARRAARIFAGVVVLLLVVAGDAPRAERPATHDPGRDAAGETTGAAAALQRPATVVLVRHAEAGGTHGGDPELTDVGARRAAALARLLGSSRVTQLYATEFRRTQQTLAPLAERTGLRPTIVPGRDLAPQLRALRELPAGSVAVVAGHSNTVPALVRGLGGEPSGTRATEHGEMLPDDAYERLFIVVLSAPPVTIELRYGP